MPIYVLACDVCHVEREEICSWAEVQKITCCGTQMRRLPSIFLTDRGPRFYGTIGHTLTGSELRAYLKRNNLMEAGDRIGGSPTFTGVDVKKPETLYSYDGQESRARTSDIGKPRRA